MPDVPDPEVTTMPNATDLVSCRLASGRMIETTYKVCQSLGAEFVTQLAATPLRDGGKIVLCHIEGEGDFLMTRDSCLANGGSPGGKPVSTPSPTLPES